MTPTEKTRWSVHWKHYEKGKTLCGAETRGWTLLTLDEMVGRNRCKYCMRRLGKMGIEVLPSGELSPNRDKIDEGRKPSGRQARV